MKALCCAPVALFLISPALAQQIASADLTRPPEPAIPAQNAGKTALPDGCQRLLPGIIADGSVEPEDHKPREIVLEIVKVSTDKPTVGSELQADVRLLNTGKQSIQIPWSTDQSIVRDHQDPGHLEWEGGSFEVLLRGQLDTDVLLKSSTSELYGSKFSPGSLLTLRPGEWVVAVIKFKLQAEYEVRPGGWKEGKMLLLVEWRQTARTQDLFGCKVANGYFRYNYEQKNLSSIVQVSEDDSKTNTWSANESRLGARLPPD
jgi:hypothetical protein